MPFGKHAVNQVDSNELLAGADGLNPIDVKDDPHVASVPRALSSSGQALHATAPVAVGGSAIPFEGQKTVPLTNVINSLTRIPELDGVRGIAILLVVYYHYFAAHPYPGGGTLVRLLTQAGSIGWTGVDLFFTLSGFLIGGILLDNRNAPNLLRVFYARRTLRIFPLYYAWLALFAILLFTIGPKDVFGDALPLWSYATYTQNLLIAHRAHWGSPFMNPTWSLAMEEQFYLLLPLVVLLCPPRWRVGLFVALVVQSLSLRYYLEQHGHSYAGLVLPPSHWDGLFCGVLGAELVRWPKAVALLRRNKLLLHGPFVLLMGLFVCWTFYPQMWEGGWLPPSGRPILLALASLSLILVAVLSPWRGGLRARWLMWVGSVSYGIYIMHDGIKNMMVHLLHRGGIPSLDATADIVGPFLSVPLTLGLAALSYRYFEAPLLRLGRHFRYGAALPR